MTQIASTWLGNYNVDATLARQIEQERVAGTCHEVYLHPDNSSKGRIYARSTSGIAVGIIKEREVSLNPGDVFKTEQGQLLVVHIEAQKVIVISFTGVVGDRALELIHLGHVLGNHHYPILIEAGKIYIELVAPLEIIVATIDSFNIPGLCVSYESRSPSQKLVFSPHSH
jgi:urease accessory protein